MRNGCHNKPERKSVYFVQDGWWYKARGMRYTREPIMVPMEDRGSPGCGHPARGEDAGCEGCRWR